MTEAEWLACDDARDLLDRAEQLGKLSSRKSLLFICACSRRYAELLQAVVEEFVQLAEQLADEELGETWNAVSNVAPNIDYPSASTPKQARIHQQICNAFAATSAGTMDAFYRGAREILGLGTEATDTDVLPKVMRRFVQTKPTPFERGLREQAMTLREIFGNPFRQRTIDSDWLTWHDSSAVRLAEAAYQERELPSGHLSRERLYLVADCLEEAGCDDSVILGHLRAPHAVHVRGCWVIDMLMGRA